MLFYVSTPKAGIPFAKILIKKRIVKHNALFFSFAIIIWRYLSYTKARLSHYSYLQNTFFY